MELQKVFKKSYMEELRRNIHVSDYQGESFPYDPSKVKSLANVYKPSIPTNQAAKPIMV